VGFRCRLRQGLEEIRIHYRVFSRTSIARLRLVGEIGSGGNSIFGESMAGRLPYETVNVKENFKSMTVPHRVISSGEPKSPDRQLHSPVCEKYFLFAPSPMREAKGLGQTGIACIRNLARRFL
jgi:hypothetical protein